MPQPLLVLNVVGLTPSLLAHAPRLRAVGAVAPLTPPLPAVTCTSQATMLTGHTPREHGIVGNGWYFRDTNEVRFWCQSHRLMAGPRPWDDGADTAVLFWWFNMATSARWSVTPRPAYHADGRKSPDVYSNPPELGERLQQRFGTFPLFHFWGPLADIRSTKWIASAAIDVLQTERPRRCLVYLPHLDYDLQRWGPDHPSIPAQVAAVDAEAGRILDAAEDYRVLVVSEYGITKTTDAVLINRALREAGLLEVIDNPVGELLDPHRSRAFAVCDHQLAHIYVRAPRDLAATQRVVEGLEGVDRLLDKAACGLNHARSGELIALSRSDRWFAYPYWLEDARAPDFARTVDIHRKPGYDPCELVRDPQVSKAALGFALLRKKVGLRTLFRTTSFDTSLVGGSHGRLPDDPAEGPLLIGGPDDRPRDMTEVAQLLRDC